MQMSYFSKSETSSGSSGLTGMMRLSSTLRQDELALVRRAFFDVEDERLAVDDLDLGRDVHCGERVVAGDHDAAVGGLVQVAQRLDGVRLERAVEDEEAGKVQLGLDLLAGQVVDRAGGDAAVEPLVAEREHAATAARETLVRLVVAFGDVGVHALERLGGALGGDEQPAVVGASLGDGADGRHALERRGELETAADVDLVLVRRFLEVRRGEVVALGELPVEGVESGLLHRVTNDAVLEKDEGVGSGEGQRGLLVALLDAFEGFRALGANLRDTLHLEVLASNGTGLVEAADVDAARVGDAERLGAEDGELGERSEGRIDGHGELHGQLGRDDGGDDEDAVEEELALGAAHLVSADPDVGRGGDGEDEEEGDEEERLDVVGRDAAFVREDHQADQLPLRSAEAGAQDLAERTAVRRQHLAVPARVGLRRVGLQHLGAAEDDVVAVRAVEVEAICAVAQLDALLEEGGGFTGKHRLVDDRAAAEQEDVAGRGRVFLGARDRDDISWEQVRRADLDPLADAVSPDLERLNGHGAELVQSTQALDWGGGGGCEHACTNLHTPHTAWRSNSPGRRQCTRRRRA